MIDKLESSGTRFNFNVFLRRVKLDILDMEAPRSINGFLVSLPSFISRKNLATESSAEVHSNVGFGSVLTRLKPISNEFFFSIAYWEPCE